MMGCVEHIDNRAPRQLARPHSVFGEFYADHRLLALFATWWSEDFTNAGLEAPPDRQELIAAWMSGYFNAERNMPTVDFGRFATNKKLVAKYCRSHRKANLMRAIRTAAF